MSMYYIVFHDFTKYGEGKKAVIKNRSPKSYGYIYEPVNEKVVIRSIFNYSKKGYKFTTEFKDANE